MIERWQVGVLLCIVSSVLINLGWIVQKFAFQRRDEMAYKKNDMEVPKQSPLLQSTLPEWRGIWIAGLVTYFFGEGLLAVSLGMAAQSMIASLGVFSLVSNAFMAPLILGEKHTKVTVYATCLVIVGCVLVVTYSSHSGQPHSVEELEAFFKEPMFLSMLGVLMVVLAGIASRALYDIFNDMLPNPLLIIVGAAICGSISMVFSKCASSIVHNAFITGKMTYRLSEIGIVLGTAVCGTGSVSLISYGVAKYPALHIIPGYTACAVVLQTVTGMFFFREFSEWFAQGSWFSLTAFCVGLLVNTVGVYWLGSAMVTEMEEHEESSPRYGSTETSAISAE